MAGLTKSISFPTSIPPNGKHSLLDLVMSNLSCSSSAQGDYVHVLVRVSFLFVSFTVIREPPKCRCRWQLGKTDWSGLKSTISIQGRSIITSAPNIDCCWNFLDKGPTSIHHHTSEPLCICPTKSQGPISGSHEIQIIQPVSPLNLVIWSGLFVEHIPFPFLPH